MPTNSPTCCSLKNEPQGLNAEHDPSTPMAASQPDSQATGTYVLGTDAAEQQRLSQQHALWLSSAQEAWGRAGLAAGERVLDLGAGPGFVSLELARQVGAGGRVLALELSPSYGEAARRAAAEAGLAQLEVRRHDLCSDPLPQEGFDLVWCRWVAMFLPSLEPLLDQLAATLKPGARVLFHEYVHWSTFGLHPDGDAVRRFGAAALASFRAAGGDPDVNRRLPSLLAARGFRIDALRPLPGSLGEPWGCWGCRGELAGELRGCLWPAADPPGVLDANRRRCRQRRDRRGQPGSRGLLDGAHGDGTSGDTMKALTC